MDLSVQIILWPLDHVDNFAFFGQMQRKETTAEDKTYKDSPFVLS